MRRGAAALGLVAALTGCSSRAPSPGGSPAPPPATTATPLDVHVRGQGSRAHPTVLSQQKSGRTIYTVRAMSFEGNLVGSSAAAADLEQPHVVFHDKDRHETIADAPRAHVTERDKSVLMTGGVHARTSDGIVLTCDSLRYDGNTERFQGVGNVVLTGPNGLALTGDHLDGDVRLQDVTITRGPR